MPRLSPTEVRFGAPLVLARTVQLINVAGPPAPTPPTAEAVRAVLRRHGEEQPELSDAELPALIDVLHRLFEVCTAPSADAAAAAINTLFDDYAHRPRLTSHGGATRWHLHLDADDDGPCPVWVATSGALALAQLLADVGPDAWGVCPAPGCGRLFVRVGPTRRRHACSDRCATRVRVQAHRRRARGEERSSA